MGMLETGECQSEVIEPMLQCDAGNRNAERARVGEVGQAKTAGLVLLPEDDVLFRAGQRPPCPHAPFQRAPDAGADLGVAPPNLFEDPNGAQTRGRLQDRDDLAIPNIAKRVGPSPATRRLLLGWQARIVLDPVAGRCAEACFGGSNRRVVGLSVTHVQPHLVVGDVQARQNVDPSLARQINNFAQPHPTARRVFKRAAGGGRSPVGLRPPFDPPPPALSHPD